MFVRSSTWWEDVVLNSFGPRDWRENFRVSKATFDYICYNLKPLFEKQNTSMKRPVSVEGRVAITLWILATPSEYRSIAHLLGVARSTVCVIVHETCRAIIQKFKPVYINFPTSENLRAVIQGFQDRWNIPQCAGSVDGTHIPVTPPAMNHTDYYNRKNWYSIIAQTVVDHNGLFRDLCIGWPGSVHDACVFSNSKLYSKVNSGELLQGEELRVTGGTIPVFLIGDSAYPLLPWLLKPFSHSPPLPRHHKNYNYRISRGRVVVEMAFGRLKACWRRLINLKNNLTGSWKRW